MVCFEYRSFATLISTTVREVVLKNNVILVCAELELIHLHVLLQLRITYLCFQ